MGDPEMVASSMLGDLQPIQLPKARHERPSRAWWEAGRLACVRHFVEPGDVLIDVGAEAGDMSALYALWGAQVVCVEPNWLAWPSIKACFDANGVEPLACVEGFCGPRDGSEWTMVHGWPASAQRPYTAAHDFRTLAEYPEIQRAPMDEIASTVGPVRHVCIDVEGAEGQVLAGASRVLAEDRPYIYLSLHPDKWLAVYGDSQQSILELVAAADYEWVPISADPHERHILLCPSERFWGW